MTDSSRVTPRPGLWLPVLGIALSLVAGSPMIAMAGKHRRAAHGAATPPRIAPSLVRMVAPDVGPGWPNASHGSRPLEKGGPPDLEFEQVRVPAQLMARPERPAEVQVTAAGLATDALVNTKNPNTCTGCQNMPIAQDEASVAVHGNFVVTSFNDIRSRCGLSTRQNAGFSVDGGATFVDGNGIPKAGNGGNVWGDASAAVNHKTGEFYIGGLYQVPAGVGAARGHFSGSAFVYDGIACAAASASVDFFDKPWMTVDSLSGNVYFTWSNFDGTGNVFIQFMRCDANLNPLSPVQTLSDSTIGFGVQFSQMAVGPGGTLYAIWQQYWAPTGKTLDGPLSVAIRRSDDFGATWGPVQYASPPHAVNLGNGGAGFLRSFASIQPTIAIDNSHGPHRGRVYVAWDQALDFLSAPILDTTTRFETEPNNTAATANVLVPGGKLRGAKNGIEEDWFKINMNAGDTYYQTDVYSVTSTYDTTREDIYVQMYSPDLGGALHLAANCAGAGGDMLYTAPRTGTYYLRFFGTITQVSPYVFYTALIPAGAYSGVARDERDQVMAWSDDGIHWSDPVRMNDSAPGADAQYPSTTVDGRGRVYCGWMDWRDDVESGTASTQYLAMSGDGGVTWGANVRAGDAVHGWSTVVCQSNGNTQGDYQMMAADGDRVVLAFTDGRLGDPDIFIDGSLFSASAAAPAVFVTQAGSDASFPMTLRNQGNFARQLQWHLENAAGWLAGSTTGAPTLNAQDSTLVTVALHPTGVAGDSSHVRLIHGDPLIPGYADTVTTVVRLTAPVDVPPTGPVALYFAPPEPDPSRGPVTLRYGLPGPKRVRVAVYSVLGARVRTLVNESSAAGPHALQWDGRDARGTPVPAGVYLVRLDAGSDRLTRRVIVAP